MLVKSMKMKKLVSLVALNLMVAGSASALTVGYEEAFDFSNFNWNDSINAPATWSPSGGSDGGGYITQQFNYFGYSSPFGGGPVMFRANASSGASGGAFVGDWLAEDVTAVNIRFKHDAPVPLEIFMRVATAGNFPGAVIPYFGVAQPGVWNDITFIVDPNSPACIGENTTCASALANVGNLQFGTNAPAALVATDQAYDISLDQVSLTIVPEPGTAMLVGVGLVTAGVARRRRR